jgi:DNA-binding transcriptional LysR family regulator
MSEQAIDLRSWRQFVAVAQTLHFGRAAQQLHMTQPPLTQAIALLEVRLGVRLFERTKRSVALTPAGLALLPQVLDVLQRAKDLPLRAQQAAAGDVGRLRLGFVSTVGFGMLPTWVQQFRAKFPAAALELVEATGDVQVAALDRAEMDAGFVLHAPQFAPIGLECLRITSEPMVLALAQAHPLAHAKSLALKKVLSEPIVLFPRRILPSVYDALSALYHAQGATFAVAQEAIQMQTIVNLVSAGMGIAWVPQTVRQFQRPGVVYRELAARGLAVPQCETSLVWQKGNDNPVLHNFVAFVQSFSRR